MQALDLNEFLETLPVWARAEHVAPGHQNAICKKTAASSPGECLTTFWHGSTCSRAVRKDMLRPNQNLSVIAQCRVAQAASTFSCDTRWL